MIKRILLIAFITTMICSCIKKTSRKQVEFTIKTWEQDYYSYADSWSPVLILYEAENKGDVDIDYYYLHFEIKCKDGSTYYDYDFGLYIKIGKKITNMKIIDTAGKEADTVEITDYELGVY